MKLFSYIFLLFSLSCFSIDKPLYVETKDEVEIEAQSNIQIVHTRDTVGVTPFFIRPRRCRTIPTWYTVEVKDTIKYIKRTYDIYFYNEDSTKEYIYKTIIPKGY